MGSLPLAVIAEVNTDQGMESQRHQDYGIQVVGTSSRPPRDREALRWGHVCERGKTEIVAVKFYVNIRINLYTLYTAIMPTRATSMPPTSATRTTSIINMSPATPIIAVPVPIPEASSSTRSTATASVASTVAPAATAAFDLPALQTESPRALAARAEQLPAKVSAALQVLARLPRTRGVNLRAGRDIVWDRMVNQEAVLGYTRGQEQAQACASCKGQARPFVKCVVVQGKLSRACTNCHYGSGSCRCSFREYLPTISFISNCL